MATLTIRNLDAALKERLRVRAARSARKANARERDRYGGLKHASTQREPSR